MDLDRAVAARRVPCSARRTAAWTRRLGALVATVALLGTAACTATGQPAEPSEPGEPIAVADWRAVALPAGMTASSLAVVDGDLLVGGSVGSGPTRAPALARGPATGGEPTLSQVPLRPTTPYGEVADLVSVAGAEARVIAVGVAHGGAHANPRWTVWTGSADGLVDRPQTFETFGGQEAGGLLGAAVDGRGPLLVGTWQGEHGLDGAIWRADGERWRRQSTITALASTADRQVSPRTVQPQVDGSVTVAGSVIELGAGEVRQRAAYWRDIDGVWTLRLLDDPGQRSWAWWTACDSRCWTVGPRDGELAVWSDSDGRVGIPTVPVADSDGGAVMLRGGRVIAVVSSGGAGRLLIGGGDSWQVYTAPSGPVRSVALTGTHLILASGPDRKGGLWSLDLATLG